MFVVETSAANRLWSSVEHISYMSKVSINPPSLTSHLSVRPLCCLRNMPVFWVRAAGAQVNQFPQCTNEGVVHQQRWANGVRGCMTDWLANAGDNSTLANLQPDTECRVSGWLQPLCGGEPSCVSPPLLQALVSACSRFASNRSCWTGLVFFSPFLVCDIFRSNPGEYTLAVCVSSVGTETSAHRGICTQKSHWQLKP